jgi:hypothetical protein
MKRTLFALCAALVLVGQGCFSAPRTPSLDEITNTPTVTPDGIVAFREGFGALPGPAPTIGTPANHQPPTVLNETLPNIPPDVTVLREWDTSPDANLLRNLTTAIGVPSGAFGASPQAGTLSLSWRDGAGYDWTYDAPAHVLRVERSLPSASPSVATDEERGTQALTATRDFLVARGISTVGWGVPAAHVSSSGAWRVTYAASRDEQTVALARGDALLAGTAEGIGDTVTRGTFELPRSIDRSNYPALAQGEVLRRLRAGGTNPLPALPSDSAVTLDEFELVLYRHEGLVNGKIRVFYIPALSASGMLRQGGTFSPYQTLVPLAADAVFGQ